MQLVSDIRRRLVVYEMTAAEMVGLKVHLWFKIVVKLLPGHCALEIQCSAVSLLPHALCIMGSLYRRSPGHCNSLLNAATLIMETELMQQVKVYVS